MKSVLRRGLVALCRRLIIAVVAIGAIVAFVYIAGGTGAQTGPPQSVPIVISHEHTSPVIDTPISVAAAPSSAPAPAPAQTTEATRIATKSVSPPTTASASAPATTPTRSGRYTGRSTKSIASAASTNASTAAVFTYVTSRDIAALINPQRAANKWSTVTAVAAKTSASCVAANACPGGEVGACNRTPSSIGTATTTQVSDGQYKDQFGNCRELIII